MRVDPALIRALERLGPHDHLCSIYESQEEHFAVAVPFIRIGIERGERCVYITEDAKIAEVRQAMAEGGIDVEAAEAAGALVFLTKDQTYMQSGAFDPEWMFTYWHRAAAEAERLGFRSLRATGETEWVFRGGPGLERWVEYESRLTHMMTECNAFALCQYNRQLCPPPLLVDIIRTHPIVVYGGAVCRNFYFVPPEELLAKDFSPREAQRLLENIRDRERVEDDFLRANAELERRVEERTLELRQSEQQVRRQYRVLEGINRIFAVALSCETEKELENSCLGVAEELTASDFGFIGEIGPDGRMNDVAISDPGWKAAPGGFHIHGLHGKVLLDGKGYFTNDPAAHPSRVGPPEGGPPLGAFLGVPLVSDGKVTGMIGLGKREGAYGEQDLEAAEALAPAVAQAVLRKRAEWAVRSAEERLREAQKMESIGVLAGGIAHDFNNLLTGVLGNASLALDCMAEWDSNRPLLEAIVNSATHAADLTRQLLAYAGKGRFVVRRVDLSKSVRSVQELLRGLVPANIEIDLDLREPMAEVEADAVQIQQILMNLVTNGAEAIGGRPGRIAIRTEVRDIEDGANNRRRPDVAPGLYACLEVRDTGVGMEPATIARIFEPFFTTKFAGRGLGLAAVHGIVRAHRGAVLVSSEPGNGSVFTVLLPIAAGAGEQAANTAKEAQNGEVAILVVDDEQTVRAVATAALERHGFRVLTAVNGMEAVETLRRAPEQISAVLLDLTMPVMGGEEAFEKLRAIRSDLPILLSSGYNQLEATRRFAGQGLTGFVGKPYSAATLVARIKAACSGGAVE